MGHYRIHFAKGASIDEVAGFIVRLFVTCRQHGFPERMFRKGRSRAAALKHPVNMLDRAGLAAEIRHQMKSDDWEQFCHMAVWSPDVAGMQLNVRRWDRDAKAPVRIYLEVPWGQEAPYWPVVSECIRHHEGSAIIAGYWNASPEEKPQVILSDSFGGNGKGSVLESFDRLIGSID